MNVEICQYGSRADLASGAAGLLAMRLKDRIAANGRATLAVPGGTTPGPMLSALGVQDLDWSKVTITLTDERQVAMTSDRSNARLLMETLLAGAVPATFVPVYNGEMALNAVYDDLTAKALPLDIAVLGMGADMHTASLFPGADGLPEALAADAPPAVTITAPGAKEPRVSLSAPVLQAAERHILIQGPDKLEALKRAQDLADPIEAPVCAVLDGATVHYAD